MSGFSFGISHPWGAPTPRLCSDPHSCQQIFIPIGHSPKDGCRMRISLARHKREIQMTFHYLEICNLSWSLIICWLDHLHSIYKHLNLQDSLASKHVETEYEFHIFIYIIPLVLQLCSSLEVLFHVTLDQCRTVLYSSDFEI